MIKVEKEKWLVMKKEQKIKERGDMVFNQVTRQQRQKIMDPKIPVKFSNDTGLGHELQDMPDKKKVCTGQKDAKGRGFISKLSRDKHFVAKTNEEVE